MAVYWKVESCVSFLERKKNKRKWLLNTFRVCCFGRHEFPMRCIESWTEATKQWWREQETNWLVVCYWFSENVKNTSHTTADYNFLEQSNFKIFSDFPQWKYLWKKIEGGKHTLFFCILYWISLWCFLEKQTVFLSD